MVLPNRQIAHSFFGFDVPDLSGGRSAGFVNRFTHSLIGAVLLVLLTLFAVVANAATAVALAALLALTTSEAQANTVTLSLSIGNATFGNKRCEYFNSDALVRFAPLTS